MTGGDARLDQIVPLAQPRLQTLSDWGYLTAFLFADVKDAAFVIRHSAL